MGDRTRTGYWLASDGTVQPVYATGEDRLANPRREDRPLYAWTVEGSVATGSLVAWAHDYVTGYYSGIDVSSNVVELQPDDSGIRTVARDVTLRPTGGSQDDFLFYRALVRAEGGRVIDAADFTIDGRA